MLVLEQALGIFEFKPFFNLSFLLTKVNQASF